jgi:leucyl-tRNA synthetase
MSDYDFRTAETHWRAYWETIDLYRAEERVGAPKHYILEFFPYPSGDGLSVGHCRNYVPACVYARYRRMQGDAVLHPMGWDAFGLPAENYAVEHGVHPGDTTRRFADNYRRQLKLVECSYDWSRELCSTDPRYYRWTQWFFLLLLRRGLAYRASGEQWWCPSCATVLANEQVEHGRCWRCSTPVTKKSLPQWYFRITDYAERLLSDIETLLWPERIKAMQRNWIGRSEGAEIRFASGDADMAVFTTRPDTLFGVTFLAVAPEHPAVERVTTPDRIDSVRGYVAKARQISEIDRSSTVRERTGVFTGAFALHPMTSAPLPIWVGDYVLPHYGTGIVMGVPAHDDRDRDFAARLGLPTRQVIDGAGRLSDSASFSGLSIDEGGQQIVRSLEQQGRGHAQVRYKLRDWLISRQRYWGAPIPIVHCARCGAVPVEERELPVRLPPMDDFAPSGDGRSPLARATDWVKTPCPRCRAPAERETDTMDGFACSSWYFLRFTSPDFDEGPFDPARMRYWMPVDTYVGGAEHAVMHLLYARFWTKVMYDAGLVPFDEPFPELRSQGVLHSAIDGQRMSKSRGNVVTPDEVVAKHGTDALRAYVLFLGPFDGDVVWDESGIKGIVRFLGRYWHWATSPGPTAIGGTDDDAIERALHALIRRVTADFDAFRFNTAIAAMMELLAFVAQRSPSEAERRRTIETLTVLLSPICPFVTEEVWRAVLGNEQSVHRQPWPTYDAHLAAPEQWTIVLQVNGKVRDRLKVPVGTDAATLERLARASDAVRRHVGERPVRSVVVVAGRLVNIVT